MDAGLAHESALLAHRQGRPAPIHRDRAESQLRSGACGARGVVIDFAFMIDGWDDVETWNRIGELLGARSRFVIDVAVLSDDDPRLDDIDAVFDLPTHRVSRIEDGAKIATAYGLTYPEAIQETWNQILAEATDLDPRDGHDPA